MATPPIDIGDGAGDKARTMLKRWRKQLAELSPDWQAWLVSSFNAGIEAAKNQKPLLPDDTAEKKPDPKATDSAKPATANKEGTVKA